MQLSLCLSPPFHLLCELSLWCSCFCCLFVCLLPDEDKKVFSETFVNSSVHCVIPDAGEYILSVLFRL